MELTSFRLHATLGRETEYSSQSRWKYSCQKMEQQFWIRLGTVREDIKFSTVLKTLLSKGQCEHPFFTGLWTGTQNIVLCYVQNIWDNFFCGCGWVSPPELVDHCAVRNVETFANLLEKERNIKLCLCSRILSWISWIVPQAHGGRHWDICTGGVSPTHQEHPGREKAGNEIKSYLNFLCTKCGCRN